MDAAYKRTVLVSREWYEQLESYLTCDERACEGDPTNLILVTPFGKRLKFVMEKKP